MTITTPHHDVPPGLDGVVAVTTSIGDVLGDEGSFHYRGHDVPELARTRSPEDVVHLLHQGSLPEGAAAARHARVLGDARRMPEGIEALCVEIARTHVDGGPLDAVRTAISAVGGRLGCRSWLDVDRATVADDALRLAGLTPTLIATLARGRAGLEPVPSDPSLSLAEDYLQMLTGQAPEPAGARALSCYLVLTMDHGSNASTFAARVVASTGADVAAGLTAAVAAMSGPLHGGAPSRALDMIDAIGEPGRAAGWIAAELDAGRRLMGFGHRVYRTEDPRAAMLRGLALELGGELVELAVAVEAAALEALAARSPDRALRTNVEFWAGVVMSTIGVPRELFTPTFVVARMFGWTAHVLEQIEGNRLIRPASRYVPRAA